MAKREMTNEEAIKILKEVREEVLAKETELSKQVFENLGIKALDLVINVLEQTRWIPVSERLPEASGDYFVTIKWKGRYSGNVYVETNMAEYRKKTKEWDCVDVIAWMPLPQAYTESEDEEC